MACPVDTEHNVDISPILQTRVSYPQRSVIPLEFHQYFMLSEVNDHRNGVSLHALFSVFNWVCSFVFPPILCIVGHSVRNLTYILVSHSLFIFLATSNHKRCSDLQLNLNFCNSIIWDWLWWDDSRPIICIYFPELFFAITSYITWIEIIYI